MLKECPFCGGEAKLDYHKFRNLEPTYGVSCTKCGARGYQFYHTEAEAVKAWNRRAK